MIALPRLRRFAMFAGVSGLGWLLDLAVFLLMPALAGWSTLAAALLGATSGVTLAYLLSRLLIFRHNGGSDAAKLLGLFVASPIVIVVSSEALAALTAVFARAAHHAGWGAPGWSVRLLAKAVVTPFTLVLNFLIARFLVERFALRRVAGRDPATP